MKLLRILLVTLVVGALVGAFIVDQGERPAPDQVVSGADLAASADTSVWFCPGGSAPGGAAEVGIDLVNVGSTTASALVAGIRSGAGEQGREQIETLAAGERRLVRLADLVDESDWMGAVVEVTSGSMVVEQTFVGANHDSDRAPCHTRTGTSWVVAGGATRAAEFGEAETILILNPFLDDAVLNVQFDADVGIDSLTGVVAPARRVTAIDVTEAVTVAGRVSAVIDVVAGQVAVSRVQTVEGEAQVGLAVTPASNGLAPVWVLPDVSRANRNDVISVVNPSPDQEAKVDLEIVADGTLSFDPIELTLRPGRTVTVDLAAESRLEGIESMAVVARSLSGVPVAVMNESFLPFGDGRVSNLSATVGTDRIATRWIAPIENDEGGVILYNPTDGIVTAAVYELVDGEPTFVVDVELGEFRRTVVAASAFATDRPVVVIESPTPIAVGRLVAGVSVHSQLIAIPTDGIEQLG
ncbi:MAG: hypothetical protein DHS20C19_23740 [Acidimicrobiales bacterium]|nr:MAG: hypothetical protein DHS20C19_23740 [Acidimicrobiales bacterium]